MAKRALIAMSGGVDSAVSALLMQKAGFDCEGAIMKLCADCLFPAGHPPFDTADAQSVCDKLGIPLRILDWTKDFENFVVDDFVWAYEAGMTPNPCVRCNQKLKFGLLLDYAKKEGFDLLVTGHYARIEKEGERYVLKQAANPEKDQSYMLYNLSEADLPFIAFPLGDKDKASCRALAEEAGLVIARKKDSQDICFIPDGDYPAFLERYTGKTFAPGNFLDKAGSILGRHDGQAFYTIGQRRGLRLPMGEKVYVVAKDAKENTVTVSENKDLFATGLLADEVNFLSAPPAGEITVSLKTRYRQPPVAAKVSLTDEGLLLARFEAPIRAVAPGQSVVLYDGEKVVGGGRIRTPLFD